MKGRVITTTRARKIAYNWHSGQWSGLYQFASSETVIPKNALWYCWEVLKDLQGEYFSVREYHLSAKNERELKSLLRYFKIELAKLNVFIEEEEHEKYGYKYPILSEKTSVEIEEQVDCIYLMN